MARLDLRTIRERGQGDPHLLADPTYGRVFARRVSPGLTWAIVNFSPLSADAVTALAILSGVAGGLLTAIPGPFTNLLAVALLQLAYLLDVSDGEVARVRGTSGRRGTYLDLIGHFIQNRVLYGAAGYVLMKATSFAPWAVGVGLAGVAFASPFGEQARLHVLGRPADGETAHGRLAVPSYAAAHTTRARVYWIYRRLAFMWNYPASMNLFCLALLADAVRYALDPTAGALVLPAFVAIFATTLTLKQLVNAMRILNRDHWAAAA
jgi:phosphatidylglycerophosphate synthase